MKLLGSLVLLAAAFACGGSSTQSNAHGTASYAKPPAQGGKPVSPQNSSDMKVTIVVAGAANFAPVAQSLCALTSGSFTEQASTSGSVSSNGSYVADYADSSGSTSVVNPTCGALKDLKVNSVSSLTVSATVPANSQNCSDYCSAKASTQCSASDSACIANVTASCTSSCKGAQKIVGSGAISASALADVNSKLGGGSGTVDANVDLVFDTVQ